uniref:Uncharacterized protein n=1 Tax=Strongyloides stercoralis TaxID=6248 RepID=A0A0K0E121_STRER
MKKSTSSYPLLRVDSKLPIEDQEEHTLSQSYFKLKKFLEEYKKNLNNNKVNECRTPTYNEEKNKLQEELINRTLLQIKKFNQILNELKKMGIIE